jgi:hypothetical protein
MQNFIPQYYFDARKKKILEEILRLDGYSDEEIAKMVHLLEPVPILVHIDDATSQNKQEA